MAHQDPIRYNQAITAEMTSVVEMLQADWASGQISGEEFRAAVDTINAQVKTDWQESDGFGPCEFDSDAHHRAELRELWNS